MTNKTEIKELKQAADEAERDYMEAALEKEMAVKKASEKWKIAAATLSRYKNAERRVELAQMRARGVVEAETGNEQA